MKINMTSKNLMNEKILLASGDILINLNINGLVPTVIQKVGAFAHHQYTEISVLFNAAI